MDTTKEEMLSIFWETTDRLLAKSGRLLSDLAGETGIKYQTMLGWRANKRLPDLYSAVLIADALDVPVEMLCLPNGLGKAAERSTSGFLKKVLSEDDPENARRADEASAQFLESMNEIASAFLNGKL